MVKNKVTFHPINNLPASIGFDIKENSHHKRSYLRYFKLESITIYQK